MDSGDREQQLLRAAQELSLYVDWTKASIVPSLETEAVEEWGKRYKDQPEIRHEAVMLVDDALDAQRPSFVSPAGPPHIAAPPEKPFAFRHEWPEIADRINEAIDRLPNGPELSPYWAQVALLLSEQWPIYIDRVAAWCESLPKDHRLHDDRLNYLQFVTDLYIELARAAGSNDAD